MLKRPVETEIEAARRGPDRAPRRRGLAIALSSVALVLGLAGAAAADDWPMFHRDARHTGLSLETAIAGSNASSLTFKWVVNTGAPSYVSPAVVYNPILDKTLVYVANQAGTLSAYDSATGERIWWFSAKAPIQSSPAVSGNAVYFGSSDHKIYAVNATTGAQICSYTTPGVIGSSPVVASPDGAGPTVYVGENGLSGSDDGGHVWAIRGADCTLRWVFGSFGEPPGSADLAGSWSPIAFARDKTGRPLVLFGGSSSDSGVYAVDARTGARVWRFQTQVLSQDDDVGAGPTISPPGMNGFSDGVVYVAGKNKIVYALNLRTGAFIWQFSIRADSPQAGGWTRSTAALVGNRLYIGYGAGVYALNATTGAKVWRSQDVGPATPEVISSPAVTGPVGDRVLFFGDLGGSLRALGLTTGAPLWSYRTGGFIYGSPAVADGKVFVASSDGFLYAFGFGGGASLKPNTTFTSPSSGSTLPNPNGNQLLSGSASDDTNVDGVLVAVKNVTSGLWWNGSTATWTKVFTQNPAALSNPGGTSTGWTASFPVPFQGGSFYAQAEAVDRQGQHDPTVAVSRFMVQTNGDPPDTRITSPSSFQVFHFPLNSDGTVNRTSFPIAVTGTATDTGGLHPGVAKVTVAIMVQEHQEFYCGPSGCPGNPSQFWRPEWTTYQVPLSSPGATSTSWSTTFPVYDHPHNYRIQAWATDKDGEVDPTRALVYPVCVRDPGNNFCQPN